MVKIFSLLSTIISLTLFSSSTAYAEVKFADVITQVDHFTQIPHEKCTTTNSGIFIEADCFESKSCGCHRDNPLRLNITMTIPTIIGAIPSGYNIDVTPIVVSPCGAIFRGEPTNILLTTAAISLPLNEVIIPKVIEGVYTVGYHVSLGAGSPVVFSLGALFNAVVVTENVYGFRQETINSNVLAFVLSDLTTPANILSVTSNCQLIDPRRCKNKDCIVEVDGNMTLNMSFAYNLSSGVVSGANTYLFTPFAVAPDKTVYKGIPIATTLGASNFGGVPLNPLFIPNLKKGNYFVGYEISLAPGSPVPAASLTYNFFGSLNNISAGSFIESATFPTQLLPLGALFGNGEIFRVTTNFQVE